MNDKWLCASHIPSYTIGYARLDSLERVDTVPQHKGDPKLSKRLDNRYYDSIWYSVKEYLEC